MTTNDKTHPTPAEADSIDFPLVFVESPYAGDVEANTAYARACMRDCLRRGEAPIASHLLYTQPGVLDDDDPEERKHGMRAGMALASACTKSVFYVDRGMSRGMIYGFNKAIDEGRGFDIRSLDDRPEIADRMVHEALREVRMLQAKSPLLNALKAKAEELKESQERSVRFEADGVAFTLELSQPPQATLAFEGGVEMEPWHDTIALRYSLRANGAELVSLMVVAKENPYRPTIGEGLALLMDSVRHEQLEEKFKGNN